MLPNDELRLLAFKVRNDFLCRFELRNVADDLYDAFERRHRLQVDGDDNRLAATTAPVTL